MDRSMGMLLSSYPGMVRSCRVVNRYSTKILKTWSITDVHACSLTTANPSHMSCQNVLGVSSSSGSVIPFTRLKSSRSRRNSGFTGFRSAPWPFRNVRSFSYWPQSWFAASFLL